MLALPLVSEGLLLVVSLFASWSDAYHRRIPNWLCALTALAGLSFALAAGGLPELGSHALHAGIALVVGMVLFRIGAFGGGDAKFYAAIAAWFTWGQAVGLLLAVALCGLVLLLVWFTYRRLAGKPLKRFATEPGDSLPYGIAIAAGAMTARWVLG